MSIERGYTPRQAAPLLGLHEQTVRRMCAAREITTINTSTGKQKARYIITESAIQAWISRHTVPARQR
jgi:excisionase family DNA binding protein